MVEKLAMAKSGKSNQKKQTVTTTTYETLPVDGQSLASQRVFDAIPLAIVSVNGEGQIQYMNRAAKSLLGESDPPMRLEDWPERFGLYLDDGSVFLPVHRLSLLRALRGENVQEPEEIILRKEGEDKGIWIAMSAEVLWDENGNIDGAIAILRNIHYRKQIELAREKQSKRTEALQGFSDVVAESGVDLGSLVKLVAKFTAEVIGDTSLIALLNDSGDKLKIEAFYDTNPTGRALLRKLLTPEFEYDHSQTLEGSVILSGEPLLIPLIPEKQIQTVTLSFLQEFYQTVGIESVLIMPVRGKSGMIGVITLFRHPGSRPFDTEDQSFLTDISHRVGLAIENCRLFEALRTEITEKLSAKQALEMSEARFRSIFESVTLGIKVLDLEGRILQTNPEL